MEPTDPNLAGPSALPGDEAASTPRRLGRWLLGGGAVVLALHLSSLHSYLLFHALAETFSVVVAFSVFAITWASRRTLQSGYLLVVGIGYLSLGLLDLLHTLAYQGMPVFPEPPFAANQLWVAARGLESLTLLAGFALEGRGRRPAPDAVLGAFAAITALLVASILWWRVFPACYVAGQGQTAFKIAAEYAIIAVLAAATVLLWRRRGQFDPEVHRLLLGSLLAAIACEFAFTLYVSNYGVLNAAGHYLKLLSYFLVHRAVTYTCVRRPYDLVFRELSTANERLRREVAARVEAEAAQAALVGELRTALDEIRTLRGILPICAHCKKIRDDAGSWDQLERYLSRHTDVEFSHGICPDCLERHYP